MSRTVAELITNMFDDADDGVYTKTLGSRAGFEEERENAFYNAIRKQALDRSGFPELPPAILHYSMTPKSNLLYGRNKASETFHDVEYQAGAWHDVKRHERTIVGAALMLDNDGEALPALIYHHDRTLYVHVYNAPLSSLEKDLFSREESTSLENVAVGNTLAAKLSDLRQQVGAYMHGAGFAATPHFLVDGNYHLIRRGPLPVMWLRNADTDHEHELLERLLLEACMSEVQIDSSHATDECQSSPVMPLEETLDDFDKFRYVVTIFDRRKEEMATVIDGAGESRNTCQSGRKRAVQAAMDKAQPVANKLALRPVVAQLAHWIASRSVGFDVRLVPPIFNREAAEKYLREYERPEASAMARSRKKLLTLSDVIARIKWRTRLVHVGSAGNTNSDILRLANAVCDAGSAALAVRDLSNWLNERSSTQTDCMNLDGFGQLCAFAERIAEPQAVFTIDVDGSTQNIKEMRLINSTVSASVDVDEAVRLMACPWVVPVIHTREKQDAGKAPTSAYMIIERIGGGDEPASRDLLHVTDVVRSAYGAAPPKPRPTVGPDDLERLKRDVIQRIAGMEAALQRSPEVPVASTLLAHACSREPDYPSRNTILDTLDVLNRALRKRGVGALAEQ